MESFADLLQRARIRHRTKISTDRLLLLLLMMLMLLLMLLMMLMMLMLLLLLMMMMLMMMMMGNTVWGPRAGIIWDFP